MKFPRLVSEDLPSAVLKFASLLVPREQRVEWLAEWSAELWFVQSRGEDGIEAPHTRVLPFVSGSFRDALWLRRNNPRPAPRSKPRLESPLHCLSLLAALAAVSVFFGFDATPLSAESLPNAQFPLLIGATWLLLPATTSLSLGEYPASIGRFRRWTFLSVKIGLILSIVYCASLYIAHTRKIQIHGLLVGSVWAFRWALLDQRRRCPVCLRLLTNPAQIGRASQTFLDWYGTELACVRGHGLLHVPAIQTSCYETQRWVFLDSSWSGLFPAKAGSVGRPRRPRLGS